MEKIVKFTLLIGLSLVALSMALIYFINIDREVAFWVFLPGFLLMAGGSFISIFGAEFNGHQNLFSLGFKIFGAGLLLFLIFSALTYFFENDGAVKIVKYISFGLCGIGFLTSAIGILKEHDS